MNKMHPPGQQEICVLALPFIGVGLNLLLTVALPIALGYQYASGRYFMMSRNKGLVYSILFYSPIASIPAFAVFNYLFTWNYNIWVLVGAVVALSIISLLACYQLLRSAEAQLHIPPHYKE